MSENDMISPKRGLHLGLIGGAVIVFLLILIFVVIIVTGKKYSVGMIKTGGYYICGGCGKYVKSSHICELPPPKKLIYPQSMDQDH